jgi:uncharacterized LabA/DUF88 family protein
MKGISFLVAGSPKSPNDFVYIYIDNSNLFIEGSKVISYLENVNVFDHKRLDFLNFYVDHGRLVTTILSGRKLKRALIFGSVPPPNDTIWDRTRDHGCEVQTYPRNEEKKVDIKLVCSAMRTIMTENPGILLLVAGNGDYCPLLEEAQKENWKIEIWFWSGLPGVKNYPFTTPISNELRNLSSFYVSLDRLYRDFTYITGLDHTNVKHSLMLYGDIIKDWQYKNEILMECFCTLKLFGRWHWEDNVTAILYFENKWQLESAKTLFEENYPGLFFMVAKKIKRRNSF